MPGSRNQLTVCRTLISIYHESFEPLDRLSCQKVYCSSAFRRLGFNCLFVMISWKKYICFFAVFALCVTVNPASGGAACFAACTVACCEVGVFAFANPLGIAVGVTGCAGVCMVACAGGLFVPPACFSNTTTVIVAKSGESWKSITVDLVKAGDKVLTLVENKPFFTPVVRNVKSTGHFEFVTFEIKSAQEDSRKLKVTPNHGMAVENRGELLLASANSVAPYKTRFISNDGLVEVQKVIRSYEPQTYTLVTVEGTVLANSVLVTTLCEEEVVSHAGRNLNNVLLEWKRKHQYKG